MPFFVEYTVKFYQRRQANMSVNLDAEIILFSHFFVMWLHASLYDVLCKMYVKPSLTGGTMIRIKAGKNGVKREDVSLLSSGLVHWECVNSDTEKERRGNQGCQETFLVPHLLKEIQVVLKVFFYFLLALLSGFVFSMLISSAMETTYH